MVDPKRPGGRAVAKPAIEVTASFDAAKPANQASSTCPNRSPSTSACEPYRELIELGLGRGRNAMAIWQDLVSDCAFRSRYQRVKRFVHKLRGSQLPQARVVILTAPGVRLLVFRSSSRIWAELHQKAFRRLGGSVRVVVMDNLREGVLVPDIYDPTLIHSTETCSHTTVP
jgi:hypothetical protein